MDIIKKFGWLCSSALQWAFSFITELFRGILAIFGIHPETPKFQHEDIKPEDVAAAYDDAALASSLDDLQPGIEARLEAVYAYARAAPEDRGSVDLSALPQDEQDWLLCSVSDADLARMASAGRIGCITALVHKSVDKMSGLVRIEEAPVEPEPEVLEIPKIDVLRDAYQSRRVGGHPGPAFKSSRIR